MKVIKTATYRLYRQQPDGSLRDLGLRTETYTVDETPSRRTEEAFPGERLEEALERRRQIADEFEAWADNASKIDDLHNPDD